MFVKSNFLLAVAIINRGYTGKTHLRGFKTLDFLLVHGGGLRLCSSELYSPNTCSFILLGNARLGVLINTISL